MIININAITSIVLLPLDASSDSLFGAGIFLAVGLGEACGVAVGENSLSAVVDAEICSVGDMVSKLFGDVGVVVDTGVFPDGADVGLLVEVGFDVCAGVGRVAMTPFSIPPLDSKNFTYSISAESVPDIWILMKFTAISHSSLPDISSRIFLYSVVSVDLYVNSGLS